MAVNIIGQQKATILLRRVTAMFIDSLVIVVFAITLFGYSWLINKILPLHLLLENSYLIRHYVSLFTITVPAIIYFVMMEKTKGATLGKKLLAIKVISFDTKKPDTNSLVIRNVCKLLPWEIAHTTLQLYPEFFLKGEVSGTGVITGLGLSYLLVFVYLVMPLIRKDRRTLYDLISRTTVVQN